MNIDRQSPARRPSGKPRGYQKWRSLLFMHWPIPVDWMRSLVPEPLELDLFDGTAYVGVVPFAMYEVRPAWCPARLGFNFLETNVRTYVVHRDEPGVYFFSLDAANRIAVWAARTLWGLPYFRANMTAAMKVDDHWRSLSSDLSDPSGHALRYSSIRPGDRAGLQVDGRVGESIDSSDPQSLEFFFLERYLLFVERRGVIHRGQVYHSPYPAYTAEVHSVSNRLLHEAGIDQHADTMPPYAHFSPGVDVEIFDLRPART